MSSIRARLAALRNDAREGANVDAAELVALQTQVAAEDQIAELAAEGERNRAAEKAERERLAAIATAQEIARELAVNSDAAMNAAYDKLVDAIEDVIKTSDSRHADLVEAVKTLAAAGAPLRGDDAAGTVAAHNADTTRPALTVDGKVHASLDQPGDFINAAISTATYRFKNPTGAPRRIYVYGGSFLGNMLPTPNWGVLPEDRRP
uniref:Uncharacterized protein n=1 Tax=Nocardia sp. C-14-1 TaxID=312532 RepID=Q2VHX8_9NOCA|nr:hypothetical protein [Nocardia sp. C-14-1]AAZ74650.1 hypothetical protein pC1.5 [Nocardia sp. C-14-1]